MSHKYKFNGLEYPSVTTIISDCTDKSRVLTNWAAGQVIEFIKLNCHKGSGMIPMWTVTEDQLNEARFNFRTISDDALAIGSEVHAAIEGYLKTGIEPEIENNKVLSGFVAFLEWKDEHKIEPIALEETVYGNCWAGTLDFRGLMNGDMFVIDFKTSRAIYDSDYGPQIAAYRSTFPADEVTGCGILRLDKETGLPEWKDFSKRYESDLQIFNKMVELYMLRHKIIAKKAGWKKED